MLFRPISEKQNSLSFNNLDDKTIVAYFVEYTVEKFEKFLII
jgi:hypothetical protein